MKHFVRTFLLLIVCVAATPAWAHKPSDSYLKIKQEDAQLSVQWDIAIKDLEHLIGLDSDQNGEITWGELKEKRSGIFAHALSRLKLLRGNEEIELRIVDLRVSQHSDGGYAALMLQADSPQDAGDFGVEYDLLFDVDPTHRGLVLFSDGTSTSTHVLAPDSRTVNLSDQQSGLWHAFVDYTREGVWHIWIGFDHILFLLSLLLPAVLVQKEKSWRPVEDFRAACMAVLKIVTVFTVAHSITLWLAVMEYVTLPSQMVEATIAISIVVTALNNLYPVLPLSGWAIAFMFGLVHGFGFANVLLDLGLSNVAMAVALLGFNVGVELGQIAIVLVFFPIVYLLRGTWIYKWLFLRGGSLLIALLAGVWTYERLFNVEIIGF